MRIRTIAIAALLVGIAAVGWSDEGSHDQSIAEVEQEIRAQLGLGPDEAIDPDAVPEELMIELGDAVMADHVQSERQHEWMDEMMGGEGSASLDAAHQWMAYQYLAGGYGEGYGRGYGMMGGSMMGGRGMMGGPARGRWGLMGDPNMMGRDYPVESPKDILDRRYAAGEITREEYRQMLEDIR